MGNVAHPLFRQIAGSGSNLIYQARIWNQCIYQSAIKGLGYSAEISQCKTALIMICSNYTIDILEYSHNNYICARPGTAGRGSKEPALSLSNGASSLPRQA